MLISHAFLQDNWKVRIYLLAPNGMKSMPQSLAGAQEPLGHQPVGTLESV